MSFEDYLRRHPVIDRRQGNGHGGGLRSSTHCGTQGDGDGGGDGTCFSPIGHHDNTLYGGTRLAGDGEGTGGPVVGIDGAGYGDFD